MNHFVIHKGVDACGCEKVTTELLIEVGTPDNPNGHPVMAMQRADGKRVFVAVVPLRYIKGLIAASEIARGVIETTGQFAPNEPIYGHGGDDIDPTSCMPLQINGKSISTGGLS